MGSVSDYTGLITSEHAGQPKYGMMVGAVAGCFANTQALLSSLIPDFDLDNAIGNQLDIVGKWIGIPRTLQNVLPVFFFGFGDTGGAPRMGEEGLPDVGARFREELEPDYPNSVLNDADYRTFLRARIAFNNAPGTALGVQSAFQFMYGTQDVLLYDDGNMTFEVSVGLRLTAAQRTLMYLYSIIPKPAGVRLATRSYFDPNNVFGFAGFPFSLTFGEESQFTTTSTPSYLDGSWYLDGSRDLSGYVLSTRFTGPPPMTGGIFAEEFVIPGL